MAHPFKKSLSMFLMILSLTACGQQGTPILPDDPNNEPSSVSNPASGDQSISSSPPATQEFETTAPPDASEREKILKLYDYVDPKHIVPDKHLEEALIYYHQNKAKLKNPSYLSVIDFSQSSAKSRFYIINMTTGSVWNIHVAHGKGSDRNQDGYAEKFSNASGSNASSLGFYLTAETYEGKNGYSLRLDGLSSTNSNVRARAVVIHGANYVQDVNVIQGRTWGCPAVSMANRTKVINLLKGGSLIYAGR